MVQDKEREVRSQFLEEAQDYLDSIEPGILALGQGSLSPQQLDAILRAAHSIKGGAGMMGFEPLAQLAHRLEDSFKVLKQRPLGLTQREEAEQLLLASLDGMAQLIDLHRQETTIDPEWFTTTILTKLDQLTALIGEPTAQDSVALLAEDGDTTEMKAMLFETEVETRLQQLESLLSIPEPSNLLEEFQLAARELRGLGEMLDLAAFSTACQVILERLQAFPDQVTVIAQRALQTWRRSQALVISGQTELLSVYLNASMEDLEARHSVLAAPTGSNHPTANVIPNDSIPNTHRLITNEAVNDSLERIDTLSSAEESRRPEQIVDIAALRESFDFTPTMADNPIITLNRESNSFNQEFAPLNQDPNTFNPETNPFNRDNNTSNRATKTDSTIRVPVNQLEQLNNLLGEQTIERNGLELNLKRLQGLVQLLQQRVRQLEQSNFQLHTSSDQLLSQGMVPDALQFQLPRSSLQRESRPETLAPHAQTFDLLEMDRYSDWHWRSQEVIESIVQIQEIASDLEVNLGETERTARNLNRTSKFMQASLTQVRMRPIADLLERFPRALRELSRKYGKSVTLTIRGGATLIDRTILEALNDPLLHLIRNGFSHGIEDAATRRARGKPEQGTIEISAAYRGSQTVITVRDDGQGINLDKIRTRLLQIGHSVKNVAQMEPKELLDFIFEPGFSTAEQVTDLSGRGIGMDVVRANLQDVRGEIQVDTQSEIGTTFTLSVPFTLSILRVLLVESNHLLLAFPANAVEEMLILRSQKVIQSVGQEVLDWQGYLVRLIRLSQWLTVSRSPQQPLPEVNPLIDEALVLLVSRGPDLVGLQVDRYWTEQEVTIRPIEGDLPMAPGFSGCTILGDGRVVPLVETDRLLDWIDGQARPSLGMSIVKETEDREFGNFQKLLENVIPASHGSPPTPLPPVQPTLLVIDDSINVRRFLALSLEKAGYRVEQAKDGQEAFDKLQGGLSVQLAICDLEMPRLDGFGFLAKIRALPELCDLPVVMLTSRSGPKHRQLAMTLGATDYFTKPFNESVFLRSLAQHIHQ